MCLLASTQNLPGIRLERIFISGSIMPKQLTYGVCSGLSPMLDMIRPTTPFIPLYHACLEGLFEIKFHVML